MIRLITTVNIPSRFECACGRKRHSRDAEREGSYKIQVRTAQGILSLFAGMWNVGVGNRNCDEKLDGHWVNP